jgi:hypothetical protein
MMAARGYPTKKDLKAAVGKSLSYSETSAFGPEYESNGTFCLVGPSASERKWYATVTMVNDLIAKVK